MALSYSTTPIFFGNSPRPPTLKQAYEGNTPTTVLLKAPCGHIMCAVLAFDLTLADYSPPASTVRFYEPAFTVDLHEPGVKCSYKAKYEIILITPYSKSSAQGMEHAMMSRTIANAWNKNTKLYIKRPGQWLVSGEHIQPYNFTSEDSDPLIRPWAFPPTTRTAPESKKQEYIEEDLTLANVGHPFWSETFWKGQAPGVASKLRLPLQEQQDQLLLLQVSKLNAQSGLKVVIE